MPPKTRRDSSTNPFLKGLKPDSRNRAIEALQRPSPNTEQKSLLFTLPAELRNRIHELVLVSDGHIDVGDTEAPDTRATTRSWAAANVMRGRGRQVIREPGLLQTCRTVRAEATKMYYSMNIFAGLSTVLFRWLERLSLEKRRMLRDVRGIRQGEAMAGSNVARMLIDFAWFKNQFAERGMQLGEGRVEDVFRPVRPWTRVADAASAEELLAALDEMA